MHPGSSAARILHHLRDGRLSAQELASRMSMDVSTVRRHLEPLHAEGLVSHEDRIDGPGRPKRTYGLTTRGWETFPRDYPLLLKLLLPKLEERAGRDAVLDAFGDIATGLAAGIAPGRPFPERLDALRDLYVQLGFEATVEDGAIVQRNCPFLQTARADPEGLCGCLDGGLIRRVLPDAHVELAACMATGDNLCRHDIRPLARPAPRLRSGAARRRDTKEERP